MYSVQLVFAQLMEHLPLHTFRHCAALLLQITHQGFFFISINFFAWLSRNKLAAKACVISKTVCVLTKPSTTSWAHESNNTWPSVRWQMRMNSLIADLCQAQYRMLNFLKPVN